MKGYLHAALGILILGSALLSSVAVAQSPPAMSQFWVGVATKGPNWKADQSPEAVAAQRAHRANIRRLAAAGKLVLAGPFNPGTMGGEWRGLYFMDVPTLEEARALVANDPLFESGHLVIDFHGWWGTNGLRTLNESRPMLSGSWVSEGMRVDVLNESELIWAMDMGNGEQLSRLNYHLDSQTSPMQFDISGFTGGPLSGRVLYGILAPSPGGGYEWNAEPGPSGGMGEKVRPTSFEGEGTRRLMPMNKAEASDQ